MRIAPRRFPRRAVEIVVAVAVLLGLYLVLPQIAGLDETWQRIRNGSAAWLAAAAAFEVLSFFGYVWLLRRIAAPLSRRQAWEITLAGVAATRIVTVAGAGGIAVTIAGLHRAGLSTREAAERQAVDLGLLYGVFFGAMVIDGVVLAATGSTHTALSIAPAVVGLVVIALALAAALVPENLDRQLRRRVGRRAASIGVAPAVVAAGVRGAARLVVQRDRALAGAIAWWAFDVAALWACVHAFGGSVAAPELLMAYLAGHVFNVLPVPGGVGPVEGGITAALVALGEPAGLALVGVLSYQLVSVWLPAAPGAVALYTLRREGALAR